MIKAELELSTHLDIAYFLNTRQKVVDFLVILVEDLNNYYDEKKERNYHPVVMASKNQIYNIDFGFLVNSFLRYVKTFDISEEDLNTIHNMFIGNDYPAQKTGHFLNYLLSQYSVRLSLNSSYFYMKTVYENISQNTYFSTDSVGFSVQGLETLLGYNTVKQYIEPNVKKDEVKLLAAGKSAKVMLGNAKNTMGKVYTISDEIDVAVYK